MVNQALIAFLKRSRRIKLALALLTTVLIVLLFPKGASVESEVPVGTVWIHDDLIASFSFPIYKTSEQIRFEKQKAAESVYSVFIFDQQAERNALDSLNRYKNALIEKIDKELITSEKSEFESEILTEESIAYLKYLRKTGIRIQGGKTKPIEEIFSKVVKILKESYETGILSLSYQQIKKDSIVIRQNRYDYVENKRDYFDLSTVKSKIETQIREDKSINEQVQRIFLELTTVFLNPNIVYNEALTDEEIQRAQNKVSPNIGIVNENERIIGKHERVTPETKLKIDSYRIAKSQASGAISGFAQYVGMFLHISAAISLFALYIYNFRKRIYCNNKHILLISIIIIIVSLLAFLIQKINISAPIKYIIAAPAASMLLTILYDSRVGFYGTVAISIIVGALYGNDYSLTLMNVVAGGFGVYSVRDIKNRNQIFNSFGFILLGYFICVLAFGLERFDSFNTILVATAFVAGNALISAAFTFGLIIFFERIFKITTDLTLLELSDFNKPLLKELARKAPGTFAHSMTIGTLVENAAETIGANPLLVRVGAYYHDIGKTVDPQSFVENQLSNENIHETLEPIESCKIIRRHVERGVEIAVENGLPKEIIEFIPMHHGTMPITYFYELAKNRFGEENVNIDDYRYAGPKPSSKETALLMFADACESAVRSLTEKTSENIENLINEIFQARIADKQLDESPLTFADVEKIKKSFLTVLLGQHHKRIKYPQQLKEEVGSQTIESERS